MISIERIKEFIEFPDIENYNEDKIANIPLNWPSNGEINISNLRVRYREDKPFVLDGFNLEIKDGEKISIVGRTGAGKSTLFLAILRLIEPTPDSSIYISGVEIRDIPLRVLRNAIAIIPQDPFIFEGTLRENIDPYDQYTSTEILECISGTHFFENFTSQTSIDNSIESLVLTEYSEPLLQSLISPGSLSTGQKQQIALARIIIKKYKIMLFDEASGECFEQLFSGKNGRINQSTLIAIRHWGIGEVGERVVRIGK